jgi:hypothetical protein
MRWMFEIMLKMDESARRLDQAFEEIVVLRIFIQPKLLQNIVRLIVTLLVPALKIGAVIWVIRDVDLLKIDILTDHIRDEP